MRGRFPSSAESFIEYPTFNISLNRADSIDGLTQVSIYSTMVITPGAYLETGIDSAPATFDLKTGNISLSGYVKNLVDAADNPQNNTAYNVEFNWTLPSFMSSALSSGNLNYSYSTLTNTSKHYDDVVLEFNSGNLASLNPGTYTVRTYTYGYENSTGTLGLIEHAGNQTTLSSSTNITFSCYETSDSIAVTACGTLDPDNPTTTDTDTSAGGGGGGGSGMTTNVESSADYQLVRGRQNEIVVKFENKQAGTLKNLGFRVAGDLARYIEVVPVHIDSIEPGESAEIKLKISSPTFIPLGRQQINLQVSGILGTGSYSENKKIIIEIHEISKEEADALVKALGELMNSFKEANFTDTSIDNKYQETLDALDAFDLEKVIVNNKYLTDLISSALKADEAIKELENLIFDAELKDINVKGTRRLVALSKLSLSRGEYELAYKRVKDAQVTYALEVKGELGSFKYYLREKPLEVSLSTLFFILIMFTTIKIGRYQNLKNRIRYLNEEKIILNELMRAVQTATFKKRTMDMSEYKVAMDQYEKRIAAVVEELIEDENKLAHELHIEGAEKRLRIEKERLTELLRQLQKDYLRDGKIEVRIYELMSGSYSSRIGDIESEIAEVEAKRELKRKLGMLGRSKK